MNTKCQNLLLGISTSVVVLLEFWGYAKQVISTPIFIVLIALTFSLFWGLKKHVNKSR